MAARIVEVEVNLGSGSPRVTIVGLPDAAVRESRDRVRTAIGATGFEFPRESRILVNLAPASLRKVGPVYDLPIALGILAAAGYVSRERLRRCVVLGELALDGRVRSVRGVLPVALQVAETGPPDMILSPGNAREAGLCHGVRARPVSSLAEAAACVSGEIDVPPVITDPKSILEPRGNPVPDLAEVRGQETARRALEVAAAGGHNLLMSGPPGAGKTMLARRLPGILPPLDLAEALETTTVHSVAGVLDGSPLVTRRPFRAPHHSISLAGLIGGGPTARPGEASLAHHGVLFLDELTEFDRRTLDALRQPIEEGAVRIARVAYSVRFPARFTLVAAMNPCRCGKRGVAGDLCRCTERDVAAYRRRVSGPLLDRMDMRIELPRVRWSEISAAAPAEETRTVADRVRAARERQAARLDGSSARTNGAMSVKELRHHCPVDADGRGLLANAVRRQGLSARGHDRVIRVARTIADLAAADPIEACHLAEALGYRSADGL